MKKAVVVAYFGNGARVAKALGIKRQAVDQWPDVVPEGRAYKIQVITRGALTVNPEDYAGDKPTEVA